MNEQAEQACEENECFDSILLHLTGMVMNDHQANPELCSYMGCVGKDDSSRILAEKVSMLIFSHLEATLF